MADGPILQIQAVSPLVGDSIPLPQYETPGAAGMDLRACLEAPVTLRPGELTRIPTGLAISLPGTGYMALLFARSGLAARHGIALSNGVGVIDSDYRGEIQVAMTNLSQTVYEIRPGERICQLVVCPVCQATLAFVDQLDETQRGQGGFGSTGNF